MRAERAVFGSWAFSVLGLLGVLVPKCPLCFAAYLCLFGLSASTAHAVAFLGRPLAFALIAGSALATALLVMQRARRARKPHFSIVDLSSGMGATGLPIKRCCGGIVPPRR